MIVLDNNEKDIVIPDYNDLDNKPSINGVVLEGNKTAAELGIDIDTTNFYTKIESDERFQLKGNYLTSIPAEYITETELNRKDFATNSDVNDEIGKLDSALSGEISKKQNTLVSGTNIKTINGESILGDGDIEISGGSVDLSDYYTKGEVDNLIDNVEVDLTGYATETWVGNNYQPKGNYLTSIPSEYVTETELNDAIAGLDTGSGIAYLKVNYDETNGYSYDGSFTDIVDAITNNKPYIIYVPSNINSYYTTIETVKLNNNEQITGVSYTHTGEEHYFTYWYLLKDASFIHKTVNERIYQNELVAGANIKTINGNSLLGNGDMEIVTDLTGYATITYVDEQIGSINTILENIIG